MSNSAPALKSVGNPFLSGPMPALFARTVGPILLIMVVNGLYAVVDAWFLGVYAGSEALSAVTLIFPFFMLLVALQTLVSNGMTSILARQLGAGERDAANGTFSGAHGLAVCVAVVLYGLYWFAGRPAIVGMAGGPGSVADAALTFIGLTTAFSPLGFFLSINMDALRSEGRLGFMALLNVSATVLNIAPNWLFLAVFHLGVAGSALGSVAAQLLCVLVVLIYRARNRDLVRLHLDRLFEAWPSILALGAPMSLGFIGISLASAATIVNIQLWQTQTYVAAVAAYGIITRLLTFSYMPLMAISMAAQTICGNNYGAKLYDRSGQGLRIALVVSFVYCAAVEAVLLLFAGGLGAVFVDDPVIIAETLRILPHIVAAYALVGPVVILSGYFQALGDAPRAAALGLVKSYFLIIPLTFILPRLIGEVGVWWSNPVADLGMVLVAVLVLSLKARSAGWSWGLFRTMETGPASR